MIKYISSILTAVWCSMILFILYVGLMTILSCLTDNELFIIFFPIFMITVIALPLLTFRR